MRFSFALLLMLSSPLAALAAEPPQLGPEAWELGFSGSLSGVEGTTRATVALSGGRNFPAGGWRLQPGAEVSYSHLRSLDLVQGLAVAAAHVPLSKRAAWPFFGVAGGARVDWIGSFREVRYPVGGLAGVKLLLSNSTLVRTDFRLLRVLGDPVEDFTEWELRVGLSLLLGNSGP